MLVDPELHSIFTALHVTDVKAALAEIARLQGRSRRAWHDVETEYEYRARDVDANGSHVCSR